MGHIASNECLMRSSCSGVMMSTGGRAAADPFCCCQPKNSITMQQGDRCTAARGTVERVAESVQRRLHLHAADDFRLYGRQAIEGAENATCGVHEDLCPACASGDEARALRVDRLASSPTAQ